MVISTEVLIWLGLTVILLVVEALSSQLITLWFGIGAAFAGVSSAFVTDKVWVNITIFVVISVASFIWVRPWANSRLVPKEYATNIDAMLGSRGRVTEYIPQGNFGRVKVADVEWRATCNDAHIESNTWVTIVGVSGATLEVQIL